MKRKKIISVVSIAALIFIMNIITVFSYDNTTIPNYIEIGLFFDKTAKSTLLIESTTGFEVGTFQNDDFVNLFNLDENKILLRKDTYYIGQGFEFNEYTGSTNNGLNSSNIQGPYHVQVGEDFKSYTEANRFLNSINNMDLEGYLSYEDEWKVFVGLYLNEASAKEAANEIKTNSRYEVKVIDPSPTRVQVINEKGNPIFAYDSASDVYFLGQVNAEKIPLVNVAGTTYRGGITAKRLSNSDMTIVNKLLLEEYLYGVVPAEMPALWPLEALKAQAVAARQFALTNFNKYRHFDFNLCATINSQVYKGYSGEHMNTNKAVDETESKVITHNEKLVQAYYHSNSGGYTEDSENIWTNPLPYLRGVKDDFSLDTPNSTWSVVFTKDEIKNQLAKHNIFIGDILDMEVLSRSNNGRVLSLVIYGTEGQEVMTKDKSRAVFGLRSTYYFINSNNGISTDTKVVAINGSGSSGEEIGLNNKKVITANGVYGIENIQDISIFNGEEYRNINEKDAQSTLTDSDNFVIEGKGFGHGVGMSQYGAKKMAELGYKYDEILTHYYTGVKVE